MITADLFVRAFSLRPDPTNAELSVGVADTEVNAGSTNRTNVTIIDQYIQEVDNFANIDNYINLKNIWWVSASADDKLIVEFHRPEQRKDTGIGG